MSGLATYWMNRIIAANPTLAAIAKHIAEQSAADATYSADDAIIAKLDEWHEPHDGQTARALHYAVIYYQEDIAAKNVIRLVQLERNAQALRRLANTSNEQRGLSHQDAAPLTNQTINKEYITHG